jgi:hypothetical protein
MSPARLKGAARRCATGLRPARDPSRLIQNQAAAGAGERYATSRPGLRQADALMPGNCNIDRGLSSGLTRPGGTDKQGSAWLRWVMNQAAQTAKRSPQFAATYTAIAKRRETKIATIAIARKLLTRAWHLLDQMQAAEASTPLQRP